MDHKLFTNLPENKPKIYTYSNQQLKDLLELLESDFIDDVEDLLSDFVLRGPALIREVLKYRGE